MVTEITKQMIPLLQDYFVGKPVEKVWLFGSCSRGEDRPDSDVDILVSFTKDSNVTLFTMGGIYMDLKNLLGREIDLVEEGTLKPFAAASAERDKMLIYERAS